MEKGEGISIFRPFPSLMLRAVWDAYSRALNALLCTRLPRTSSPAVSTSLPSITISLDHLPTAVPIPRPLWEICLSPEAPGPTGSHAGGDTTRVLGTVTLRSQITCLSQHPKSPSR